MSPATRVAPVTCLGCGCACDDLQVQVEHGRILDLTPPCPLAREWFGDGQVPSRTTVAGAETTLEAALEAGAELLAGAAGQGLVVLAPDVSAEAYRSALALADTLRLAVDTPTSEPAAAGLLAAQRRGRAAATLGEVRNRADVLLFWGIDPAARYPRYLSRYALEPQGTHVPNGRAGRTVIAASIGADRGPAAADLTLGLSADDEIPALSVMRAIAMGNTLGDLTDPLKAAADAAGRLVRARYAVIVHEAEPGAERARDPYRAEGLIALTQALNGVTRAALSSLRAGGNRSGAEAVLTWQTGFPMAVSYASGAPRYAPSARGMTPGAGASGGMLVVGSAAAVADGLASAGGTPIVVIGPRASAAPFPTRVAIDTGVAGIHEPGTAYRMDDVPLPLTPPLPGGRPTVEILDALLAAVRARRPAGGPA